MSVPSPQSENEDIRAEEVEAVYRTVTFGSSTAVFAAFVMVTIMTKLGFVDRDRGVAFVLYLSICSATHIILTRLRRRDPDRASRWRFWGYTFGVVGCLEGVGWGGASFLLLPPGNYQAELLGLLVMGGVTAGAVSAFGAFLPAFVGFVVPTILPYVVRDWYRGEPMENGIAVLVLLYLMAILFLGHDFHQSFRRRIKLQIHAEKLASQLRDQIEIAEAANRAKSSFLAAASHDLRQPVHAMGLFIGALRAMPMSKEAMSIIEQIETSSQAMDGLFAALLDISKLDAGTVEVRPRVFPVAPMLERIHREYAPDAADKGIALRMYRSRALVQSDPILVERVLRNLVSNAVRYTTTGRVVFGCRRRRSTRLDIEVWDTGPGISVENRELIFREYFQLQNPERDREKGLGLGLAIVRRLTRLLDCDLSLQSEVGRGSCFSIKLPLVKGLAPEDRVPSDLVPLDPTSHMIVVVDDEAHIRAAMATILEKWGHSVCTAASTEEVMAKLAELPIPPALIISDFRLRGDETGLDVIAALRQEYNEEIPAILITGDTAPERLIQARQIGLLLLHKPVSNVRLRSALANLLASQEDVGVIERV